MRKVTFSAKELEDMISHYSFEIKKLSFQLENAQKTLEELQQQAKEKPAPAPAPKPAPAPAEEAKPQIIEAAVKEKPAPKAKTKAKAKTKTKATGKPKPAKAEKEAPKRRGRPRKEKVETAAAEIVEAPKKKRGRPKKEVVATPAPKKKESKILTPQDEESQPKGYRLSDWDMFIINTIRKSGRVMVNAELMDKALSRVKKEKLDLDEMSLRGKLNRSIHKLSNRRGDLVKLEDYPGKGFAYGLPEWKDENGNIRAEFTESLN